MMGELKSIRDLYQFTAELMKRRGKTQPTLEVYLENLQQLAQARCGQEVLLLSDFADLLELARRMRRLNPPLDPR